jgi:hypothetical protein
MSGGALFTEDIWKIICEGLRGAMRSTLAPVKHLIPCYQVGSNSVSGDDGCRVRVLTRRDASWEQTIRHGQLAEQVSEITVACSFETLIDVLLDCWQQYNVLVVHVSFNSNVNFQREQISIPGLVRAPVSQSNMNFSRCNVTYFERLIAQSISGFSVPLLLLA